MSTPETTERTESELAEVFRLAASGVEQGIAADRLGRDRAAFSLDLQRDPALRRAWDSGRQLFESRGKKPEPAATPEADDAAVLGCLLGAGEPQRRQWISERTGLCYDRVNDALYRLITEGRARKEERGLFELFSAAELRPKPEPKTRGHKTAEGALDKLVRVPKKQERKRPGSHYAERRAQG